MGDFVQGSDILKKIGFDGSNQWVIYDESYQIFFNWFTNNITNKNTLIELEILESNELKKDNEFCENEDLDKKLAEVIKEYPNILIYSDEDVLNFKIELQNMRQIYDMYDSLSQQTEKTRFVLNRELHKIESEIQDRQSEEDSLYKDCLQKARRLQEIQKENRKFCSELNECIVKLNSPPLFTHQFPIEQYLLKCDSFMQYFSLYLQENFKFQNFLETEKQEPFGDVISLEKLKNQIFFYNEKCVLAKAKVLGLQKMVEEQDCSKIHAINMTNLKKETKELGTLRSSFDITYETLVNDLKLHLQQIAQQQLEFVLYQNTKRKIERARQRLDNINFLSKIISNVLKNSELMWIMMQLDAEKLKNRIDNSENLLAESLKCCKRVDLLKQIQISTAFNLSEDLIGKLSEIVFEYLGGKNFQMLESLMIFIEKINRSLDHNLGNVPSGRRYNQVTEILHNLKFMENVLSQYIFDGPTDRPVLQNVKLLRKILKSKILQEKLQKSLRKLRSEFHENISLINSDELLKSGQLLWIWFLTEPKKVIDALEKIRKAAQNVPHSTGIKTLVGIKRQKD